MWRHVYDRSKTGRPSFPSRLRCPSASSPLEVNEDGTVLTHTGRNPGKEVISFPPSCVVCVVCRVSRVACRGVWGTQALALTQVCYAIQSSTHFAVTSAGSPGYYFEVTIDALATKGYTIPPITPPRRPVLTLFPFPPLAPAM